MPKIRLFTQLDLTSNSYIDLTIDNIHYLSNVMRQKSDDEILMFNGRDGEWLCRIDNMQKKKGYAKILKQTKKQKTEPDIWLCFALVKKTAINNMAQKATELGVSKLQPIITEYTSSTKINIKRLNAIAIEAAEQCDRLTVPELSAPVKLNKLIDDWDSIRQIILCDESGGGKSATKALNQLKNGKYAIFIGPEGGFSKTEFEIMHSKPYIVPIGMGPRILRADTAAIAALTCYMSILGDWDNAPNFKQ